MLKRTALLFVFLVAVAPTHSHAFPREIWSSSETYGDPTALMRTLKRILSDNSNSERFKISWGLAAPHGSSGGTLIYDRSRQLLWIQYSEEGWDDEEDGLITANENTQQWRFRGVTSKMLRSLFAYYGDARVNAKREDEGSPEVSFFPRLTEFGARGGLVGRTLKSWREKWVDGRRVRVR